MRFPSVSFVFLSMALSALTVQGAPQNSEAQLQMRATDAEVSMQRRDLVDTLHDIIQRVQGILDSLLQSSPTAPGGKLEVLVSEPDDSPALPGTLPSGSFPIPVPSGSFPIPIPSGSFPILLPTPMGTSLGSTPAPSGTASAPGAATPGPQGTTTVSAQNGDATSTEA